MRTFTQKEKRILKRIAELKKEKNMHSILLSDICIAFLKNEIVSIYYSKRSKLYSIEIFFDRKIYSAKESEIITKKKEEIEINIINTIFLLNFLKEKSLLYEISNKKKSDEFDIERSKGDFQKDFSRHTDFDSMTKKMVVDSLVNKQYFINQEFIDFVKYNFRTPDEIRFRKSMIVTCISISIALLIGLSSIVISIKNHSTSIKINNEQIEQFENSINEINDTGISSLSLDSLTLKSINNIFDTLNENFLSIKRNQELEIETNKYLNFETILIKTHDEISEIKQILINSSANSGSIRTPVLETFGQ